MEPDRNGNIVLVAVVALLLLVAVLGAAYFVIAFLLRRVLLADIVEPIRRGHRIVTQVGQHLQVICLDPARVAKHVNDLHLLRMTSAASGTDARALDDIMREVSEAPASQRIGISDLQESPDDASLLEKKLEIVEAVMDLPNQTVLLFTAPDRARPGRVGSRAVRVVCGPRSLVEADRAVARHGTAGAVRDHPGRAMEALPP